MESLINNLSMVQHSIMIFLFTAVILLVAAVMITTAGRGLR